MSELAIIMPTYTKVSYDECPFFFEEKRPDFYKVYNDGGHFVATAHSFRLPVKKSRYNKRDDMNEVFYALYNTAVKEGQKGAELTNYLVEGMAKLYPNYADLVTYVEHKVERARRNLYARKKRFRRKAYLNKWNYFVTITYDDKKHTAESFRKKLRKCLSNLHTRRGWRYMGVFEYAPETGRLHFHALVYVPVGEMLGQINAKEDYEFRNSKMRTIHINSFFSENFGRNDFEQLNPTELKSGTTISYLLKYLAKSGERIIYCRGIPSELYMKIAETEFAAAFFDFVQKYVLFDDSIKWERDIMPYKPIQVSFWDCACNPAVA